MAKRKQIEFCGAFSGKATLREGETKEQFAGRVERALLHVLDRYAKRLNVNVGVDYCLQLHEREENMKRWTDEKLDKEIAFAELSLDGSREAQAWLNLLLAESRRRG